MTSKYGLRQPLFTYYHPPLIIMKIISKDVLLWVYKAQAIKQQQRCLFRQSFYKYHRKIDKDKRGVEVWTARDYTVISQESHWISLFHLWSDQERTHPNLEASR